MVGRPSHARAHRQSRTRRSSDAEDDAEDDARARHGREGGPRGEDAAPVRGGEPYLEYDGR